MNIIYAENKEKYINAIHKNNEKYDMIIIDDQYKYECCKKAIEKINNNGVIILDNADWYKKATNFLREQNFIEINFCGHCPRLPITQTTSFFLSRNFNLKLDKDYYSVGALKKNKLKKL